MYSLYINEYQIMWCQSEIYIENFQNVSIDTSNSIDNYYKSYEIATMKYAAMLSSI